MKKNTFLLLLAIALLISAGSIWAYLTLITDRANEFTVRHLETELVDQFGIYDKLEAGKTYKKKVSVRNNGSVPCYVRAFAQVKKPFARGNTKVDYNREDWTLKGDYWYYKDILDVGKETSPLFTEIRSEADIVDFEMICYQEAVQAEGNPSATAAFK